LRETQRSQRFAAKVAKLVGSFGTHPFIAY
jgi:hypothetical protein